MHVLIFDNKDIIAAAIDINLMSLLVTLTNSRTLILDDLIPHFDLFFLIYGNPLLLTLPYRISIRRCPLPYLPIDIFYENVGLT